MISDYLHGMYQPGAEEWMRDKPGWIVFTEAIGYDPNNQSGGDYTRWSDQGFGIVVRLNNGYKPVGTIPEPDHYQEFAQSCANYIAKSKGCSIWIIGNEPNHSQERPHGKVIAPEAYADCFRRCYTSIKTVGRRHSVLSAAIAPWNVESGFWLDYFRRMLNAIPNLDGIDMHTYTHGASPALITSTAKMDEPYQHFYWNFLAYRDFLAKIPARFFGKPLYLTETNQGDQPWLDQMTGWVQEAMQEIHRWNLGPSRNKFACCCLFRYPKYDKWYIEGKEGVLRDFRRASEHAYPSGLAIKASRDDYNMYIPLIQNESGEDVVPDPTRDVVWDPRLSQRNVRIMEPKAPVSDGWKWKCIIGEFYDSVESQGRHHIYIDVVDEDGNRAIGTPVVVRWDGGEYTGEIEEKSGEEYGFNMPMYASGSAYRALVNNHVSDMITGMGLGDINTPHQGDHVSYGFVFRRVSVDVDRTEDNEELLGDPPKEPDLIMPSSIIDPISALAFLDVESGNKPFTDGLLTIRFEVHRFDYLLNNRALFDRHFKYTPRKYNEQYWRRSEGDVWRRAHGSMQGRHELLRFARGLNDDAALKSTGMGIGQVMGENHERIGYSTPQAMFNAFSHPDFGVNAQLMGFVNYILSSRELVSAVRNRDWGTMARLYNGPGNVGVYAPLLEESFHDIRNAVYG